MEHKPQPITGPGGRLICRECGKGVSRRQVATRKVYVHHNPTGIRRFNGRVR